MSHAATVRAYLDAYAARDLAAVGALLAPDVVLRDWKIRVLGKPAALAETQKNFGTVRSLGIEVLAIYDRPGGVAAELRIEVENLDGVRVTLHVVDVFDFDAEGRITAIRAYIGRSDEA